MQAAKRQPKVNEANPETLLDTAVWGTFLAIFLAVAITVSAAYHGWWQRFYAPESTTAASHAPAVRASR